MVALNEAGKVRVTWSKRILGSGQVITGYSVQYRRKGTTSYTTHSVSDSNTTSYTITDLNLGTVYEVRVASVGPLGLSRYCCGSGKEVTTYNCECKALKVHVAQILSVDTCIGHCSCLLCMPNPFLLDLASLLNASQRDRVLGSFCVYIT